MINHIFVFCLLVRDAIFQKYINSNVIFSSGGKLSCIANKTITALQCQHKSKSTYNENNVFAKSKLGIT